VRTPGAEEAKVDRLDAPQDGGEGQREEADEDFEDRVGAEGALHPGGEAGAEGPAEGQPGHEGRQHGGDGELAGAEDAVELAAPDRLVHQPGRA
jgi:hypothetical protein